MKKRIGSKLYDTDAAICVLPDQHLFRQPHRQTFFLFDGGDITPISLEQAADLIRTYGGDAETALLTRKPDAQGRCKINISAASADRLAEYCRQHGVSQKKVIEDFIYSLPLE